MLRKRPEDSYAETAILTASQEELVVKLFDGLIQFTRHASEKLKNDPRDIEFIHNHLRKGQRACTILMSSLNFENGGEVAENLFRIYEHWHHELVIANMRQDRERLERLLPVFVDYRKTWTEVINKSNASKGWKSPADQTNAATAG